MSILETIASVIMLGITVAVFWFLYRLYKKTKEVKSAMYPFVLLMRADGETAPLGTYALREYAVAALQGAVAKAAGVADINMAPDTVLSGFTNQGLSWRGKDAAGKKVNLWVAEVPVLQKD